MTGFIDAYMGITRHQPVNIFWHINLVTDPHNGLDNGLLPICHQAIILTNAVLLSENKPLPEPTI